MPDTGARWIAACTAAGVSLWAEGMLANIGREKWRVVWVEGSQWGGSNGDKTCGLRGDGFDEGWAFGDCLPDFSLDNDKRIRARCHRISPGQPTIKEPPASLRASRPLVSRRPGPDWPGRRRGRSGRA